MKVKIKNEMDNIQLKCKHNEVILLRLAISDLIIRLTHDKEFASVITAEQLNNLVFDSQEFESDDSIVKYLQMMLYKLNKKLDNINVY